ncbi:uncharacterized protein LOC111001685 isoform X2 [Pieris rapae]|uniref:uncharacterized protein LOC111001685 isoform X2 n=1 Tax=Pieris rapae TaxID=64459 RepID=UPI001E27D455|nr:uncharacterized protein LOC111001685 isoform X2 [Pieris rapae]
MSDTEEPAAKMSKIETSCQGTDDELDEGQEEWLSEGILTDDDGTTMPDQNNQTNESLDVTKLADESMQNEDTEEIQTQNDTSTTKAEDIEQALDSMEGTSQNSEIPEALGTFLVRKKTHEAKEESDIDESIHQSDDDGHSTDELLRMLGEDDQKTKTKELTKKARADRHDDTSDDDDVFKQVENIREVRVARSVLNKKVPTKAEPEDMSDEDTYDVRQSSEEVTTMKRIFGMAKERASKVAAETTGKAGVIRPSITVTKKAVIVDKSRGKPQLKTITREVQSIIKKPTFSREITQPIKEEVQYTEEYLDEDMEELSQLESKPKFQDIMKPEVMDEEVPSDCDTNVSEDDSLFDDFQSSDSEDVDEWFTLDIRDEKAGDYIPLLGSKALKLLSEEKERVETRLANLKVSLSALAKTGKQQTEQLKKATSTLSELDAALKAS